MRAQLTDDWLRNQQLKVSPPLPVLKAFTLTNWLLAATSDRAPVPTLLSAAEIRPAVDRDASATGAGPA